MKKIILMILVGLLAIGTIALSKEASKEDASKAATTEKKYTEEEFKAKLSEEIAKALKKSGSGHLVDFSKELLEKEEKNNLKEMELKKVEEELRHSQQDFQKKIVEFEESQKKFLGCIESQKESQDRRVAQMVDVIANMKPQTAADVLSIQDADLSVSILSKLDTVKASKIFNLMDKEVTAKLQKQFVQMKK